MMNATYFKEKFEPIEKFGRTSVTAKCVLFYCKDEEDNSYDSEETLALASVISKAIAVPKSVHSAYESIWALNDGHYGLEYGSTPKERIMKVLEIAIHKGL